MLRMNLAPCAAFVVTNDLMVAAAKLAREYPGVRLHTHLAENQVGAGGRGSLLVAAARASRQRACLQEDIDYSEEVYHCRPGKYIECAARISVLPEMPGQARQAQLHCPGRTLAKGGRPVGRAAPHRLAAAGDRRSLCRQVGWDKDDVWFAHCCMLDKQETKQFADNGIGIAHCPSSNMRLASGDAPHRQPACPRASQLCMAARVQGLLQRARSDRRPVPLRLPCAQACTPTRAAEPSPAGRRHRSGQAASGGWRERGHGRGRHRQQRQRPHDGGGQAGHVPAARFAGRRRWSTPPRAPLAGPRVTEQLACVLLLALEGWPVQRPEALALQRPPPPARTSCGPPCGSPTPDACPCAAMSCREALRIAIQGGARNLGRQDDIGQIAPGFAADIVGWRVDGNIGFSGAGLDPVAGLVLCTPSIGFVDLSIINGRTVVRDGKLTTLDLGVRRRRGGRPALLPVLTLLAGAGPGQGAHPAVQRAVLPPASLVEDWAEAQVRLCRPARARPLAAWCVCGRVQAARPLLGGPPAPQLASPPARLPACELNSAGSVTALVPTTGQAQASSRTV